MQRLIVAIAYPSYRSIVCAVLLPGHRGKPMKKPPALGPVVFS